MEVKPKSGGPAAFSHTPAQVLYAPEDKTGAQDIFTRESPLSLAAMFGSAARVMEEVKEPARATTLSVVPAVEEELQEAEPQIMTGGTLLLGWLAAAAPWVAAGVGVGGLVYLGKKIYDSVSLTDPALPQTETPSLEEQVAAWRAWQSNTDLPFATFFSLNRWRRFSLTESLGEMGRVAKRCR